MARHEILHRFVSELCWRFPVSSYSQAFRFCISLPRELNSLQRPEIQTNAIKSHPGPCASELASADSGRPQASPVEALKRPLVCKDPATETVEGFRVQG